jgi:hypothetical protein
MPSGGLVTSVVFQRISITAEHAKLVMEYAAAEIMDHARAIALYSYAARLASRSADAESKALRMQAIQRAEKLSGMLASEEARNMSTPSPQELLFSKARWLAETKACELLLAEQVTSSSVGGGGGGGWGGSSGIEAMDDEPSAPVAGDAADATLQSVALICEVLASDPDMSEQDVRVVERLGKQCEVFVLDG